MSDFVNPGNSRFKSAVDEEIYIDKTELLAFTNSLIGKSKRFICNSRPRRFGKSLTANMLAAYYCKTCDSKEVFSGLKIEKNPCYEQYLNKFDVIQIDIQWFYKKADVNNTLNFLTNTIIGELREAYKNILDPEINELPDALSQINSVTGNQFVIIIDEWDMLIREAPDNKKIQEQYIDFLRRLFKGMQPEKYIALAYLTGILPIKKYNTQSALNNFEEYTMVDPGKMAPYIGFTEAEVKALAEKYGQSFQQIKRWYDGYLLGNYQIYNPKAVVKLMERGIFQSYWSMTGTYESIVPYIQMDFKGLKVDIINALAGIPIKVIPFFFQNDTTTFNSKDDVLTFLIHLGYLGYNQLQKEAFIPNEEIRFEFEWALKTSKWEEITKFIRESDTLVENVLERHEKAVAEAIGKIHQQYASVIRYNDENSLSSVLAIAFLGTIDYYFKPLRELPTGKGYADFVYLPRPENRQTYPALIVELKWNKDTETALDQIKNKDYPEAIKEYTGKILLVAISYDKKNKQHFCRIDEFIK